MYKIRRKPGKSESKEIKSWILSQSKQDTIFQAYQQDNGSLLILGYSSDRAKKDAHHREKGVKRLQKACSSGMISKENINKRGYNKFLDLEHTIKGIHP